MEIVQIEKQFQMWMRFLWMILGASITLACISFGNLVYSHDWPGFGNYVGGIWTAVQLLATLPGLYLLIWRRWRPVPLTSRIHTIFGYFAAGWLNLLSLGLIDETGPATDYYVVVGGSALLLLLGYFWTRRRASISREEIFP